ncbi:hypothetical protein HMPREF1607_04034 [Escherichia coli 908524]|nr:hypothetical protein HMPREF1607_04034 [Escherichia coli 908524]
MRIAVAGYATPAPELLTRHAASPIRGLTLQRWLSLAPQPGSRFQKAFAYPPVGRAFPAIQRRY